MSTPAPKISKHDVVGDFRRGQILAAARECFSSAGLASTTVDGIARAAGVAKGTVYLYYKSKDEILRQVLAEDLEELEHTTVPAIEHPGSMSDRIERFLQGMLAFFDSKRDFVEQCHFEMTPEVRKRTWQRYERVFRAQTDAWRRVIGDAIAAGTLPAQDADASALSLVALAQGLSRQRLHGWSTEPLHVVAARATVFALKGLSPQ